MTLQTGKLPAALLAELLAGLETHDPRVLLGPGIGRDAAVIDLGAGRALVAKTDPITFATDAIGWYAVHVNANDIACLGVPPAWFLATALLPVGSSERLAREIFDQLASACASLNIELVGGHSEVTAAVDRPVIVGAMLGEGPLSDIVMGSSVAPGDVVLLSKGIAIEGTALLAREASDGLVGAGVDGAMVERAAGMLYAPGISVVADAQALCRIARPRLMHDPTEGGVATALYELAAAAGRTIRIDASSIAVYPETQAVCDALGLDPMGLLASGALLAIVSEQDAAAVIVADGPESTWRRIGSIEHGRAGVILGAEDPAVPLPEFARDELARFFDGPAGAEGVRAHEPGRIASHDV